MTKADSYSISSGSTTSSNSWFSHVKIPVYILVIIFAMASWIDINGVWTQVPLLVNELPESWNLPSYLIIIIQIANIGPITYTLMNRCAPNKVKEWPVIYLIITVGAIACLLLMFFWSETSYIFGAERSTAMFILSFFLATVDTTSSVVFLPYMANFKVHYMTAYYIGEGFSGLLPAIVGLIQGVGSDPDCRNTTITVFNETLQENITEYHIIPHYDEPLFSVEVFFGFLFVMLVLSEVAFTLLHCTAYCQEETLVVPVTNNPHTSKNTKEMYTYENHLCKDDAAEKTALKCGNTSPKLYTPEVTLSIEQIQSNQKQQHKNHRIETAKLSYSGYTTPESSTSMVSLDKIGMEKQFTNFSQSQFIYLFLLSCVLNGLGNGVMPSTSSYSALPYGNRAYNLSNKLGMAANPIACFIAIFLPCESLVVLTVVSSLGLSAAGYQLYLADMSPYPPLQGDQLGEILTILTAVLMIGLFSYGKVTIASMMRDDDGRRGLLWCGVSQQVGSFFGAIIIFIFVNIIKSFKDMPTCGFI